VSESILNQITETWGFHNRSMLMFLREMPDDAFSATLSKRGGRDLARQFAHVISVRIYRMDTAMKETGLHLDDFPKDYSPSRDELINAFEITGRLMDHIIAKAIEQNGAVSNFKRGLIPMLGYYITHEAHHKGHALLTMKECGIKIPNSLKWGIWEWNKI
jgi:hypothetical protein